MCVSVFSSATEWEIPQIRRGGDWCVLVKGWLSTVVPSQWAPPFQQWPSHTLRLSLKVMRLALKHEICMWSHWSSDLVLLTYYCWYTQIQTVQEKRCSIFIELHHSCCLKPSSHQQGLQTLQYKSGCCNSVPCFHAIWAPGDLTTKHSFAPSLSLRCKALGCLFFDALFFSLFRTAGHPKIVTN